MTKDNAKACPQCFGPVKVCQINENEAVELCVNLQCSYPLGRKGRLKFVKRSYRRMNLNAESTGIEKTGELKNGNIINEHLVMPSIDDEQFYLEEFNSNFLESTASEEGNQQFNPNENNSNQFESLLEKILADPAKNRLDANMQEILQELELSYK